MFRFQLSRRIDQVEADTRDSFAEVGEDIEVILDRLDALEHNMDLRMVSLIVPKGNA